MRVAFHPDYVVALPEGHPFPMPKFRALHDILLRESIVTADAIMTPTEVPIDMLALAHTEGYVRKFLTSSFTDAEVRRLGLPWTAPLIRRSRLAVTGTLLAARAALEDGLAGNLAGGTHHACPDHGEGFCVLNDVAITLRTLLNEGAIGRAVIIDLDVHQGNGNAIAFGPEGGNDERVFTFSMHGAKNFPMKKPASDLDVGLPDGCDDDDYLRILGQHLPQVLDQARPDLAMYLAGVDVVQGDRYGRLAMTQQGLRARDRYVLQSLREAGIATTILLSGGYAPTPDQTADLHAVVYREAARLNGMALSPAASSTNMRES